MAQPSVDAVRKVAEPLTGSEGGLDAVVEQAKDKHFVLIGEASHGTREFYHHRAALTRRLVEEAGFEAVAVEGDWPDAYRANRYVQGSGRDASGRDALADFTRFPLWMWRNAEVLEFLEWLRTHNSPLPTGQRVGFYGLDLYSLYASAAEVIGYLDRVDAAAADAARERYGCLDHATHEPQAYGRRAAFGLDEDCESEVVRQLIELRRKAGAYLARDGIVAADEQFQAEQNARVVRNAEVYYRAMYRGGVNTWNLRDEHMAETFGLLSDHLRRLGRRGKVVVWAHNSHVGDARATEKNDPHEINIGQLARERYGDGVMLVGYTTYDGTVSAASRWDTPVELKAVRPALSDSFEALFHATGTDRFLLPLWKRPVADAVEGWLLERAIGVLYLPRTERYSHYFPCRLARQFDAVFHFDRTHAVQPLDRVPSWDPEKIGATDPYGI